MPKDSMHKLKLLYLADIFERETDEDHALTIAELIEKLAAYGVSAERKSVYSDIESLSEYGMDILTLKDGKANAYALASRDFELAELKLLVDAVQSSKFITRKKSAELIEKLERFTSRHQAKKLHRQVYVANRVKTMNESIYYTVDDIHTAIIRDVKIRFRYFDRNMRKEKILRHDGAYYTVSPLALTWDDENYYLVAFDEKERITKHYRVDKITDIEPTDEKREQDESRNGENVAETDMALYSKAVFGMFGGKPEYVELLCDKSLAGVVIDRFGENVPFRICDGERFFVSVNVVPSPQFYSWVFGFGDRMKITFPPHAAEGFEKQLNAVRALYADGNRSNETDDEKGCRSSVAEH